MTAADGRFVMLKLPAPVGVDSFSTSSLFASRADYNGDGFDDLAVGILSTNNYLPAYSKEGLYIVFGHGGAWPAQIDLTTDADAILTGFKNLLWVDSAGDVNADGCDDLLAGELGASPWRGATYLFRGGPAAFGGSGVLYQTLFGAGSAGDTGGFTISNHIGAPASGLWHLSTGRSGDALHSPRWSFYFGTGEGIEGGGNYDVGDTAGYITSPPITLSENVSSLELSFDYYLRTERGGPGASVWDKASVEFSSDGGSTYAEVASNNDVLVETIGADDYWHRAVLNLGAYTAGQTLKFRFRFDTVDDIANDYEGWYVDDVTLRSTLKAPVTAATVLTGHLNYDITGRWTAGVGDVNGDGYDDFIAGSPGNFMLDTNALLYLVYGRAGSIPGGDIAKVAATTFDIPYDHPELTIRRAGNVAGSSADDFVIAAKLGASRDSYLVFASGDPATIGIHEIPDKLVTALGDINGDGLGDLSVTAAEQGPTLIEDGTQVEHQVEQVFLNSPGKDWTAPGAFNLPDMVFENARPRYAAAGQLTIIPGLFAGLGDVSGDGIDDFAFGDTLGGKVRVYFGAELTPVAPPETTAIPPRLFRFTLATPWMGAYTDRTGLDLNEGGTPDTHDAFRVEGSGRNDHLSQSQSVGDFNRDGYDDLLVWDDHEAHLLLGPVKLSDADPIETRSEINIGLAGLGAVGTGIGDLDGDGFADLVFVRHDFFFNGMFFENNFVVSALFGNPDSNRSLSAADAQTIASVSAWEFGTSQLPQLLFFNWDTDAKTDLVLFGRQPPATPGATWGWVFRGADFDRDSGESLESADAYITIAKAPVNLSDVGEQVLGPDFASNYVVGEIPNPAFTVAAADVNGDGRDELLFASPDIVAVSTKGGDGVPSEPLPYNIGRVYGLSPAAFSTAGGIALFGDIVGIMMMGGGGYYEYVPAVVQDLAMGAGVFDIGDVNRDGCDDIAVTRTKEDAGMARGSVFLYYGPLSTSSPERAAEADVIIRRVGDGVLPVGTWIEGPIAVTAGDFDGIRTPDLAISQPWSRLTDGSTTFDEQSRGIVHVIWDVALQASGLVLVAGPVDLGGDGLQDMLAVTGQSEGDQFGTLPATPNLNLDNDRYDDLVIGASLADSVGQSVKQDAGKIYAVYGSPRRLVLPGLDAVVELTNRSFTGLGDRLVDPATGRPVTFTDLDTDGDGTIDTTDFTLGPSQDERWYRFTTAGDGKAGNVIRVLPTAYADRNVILDGAAGYMNLYEYNNVHDTESVLQVGGDYNYNGLFDFDLTSLLEQLGDPNAVEKAELILRAMIQPNLGFYDPGAYVTMNGKAYFLGLDSAGGADRFCVTDGTIQNTLALARVEAKDPHKIVAAGGALFFVARDSGAGYELWASDGTGEGTKRVTDIFPGTGDANISQLTAFGGSVYFQADEGLGLGLWKVTPQGGGAYAVQKLASNFIVGNMVAAGSNLFLAQDKGWVQGYHKFGLYSTSGGALVSLGDYSLPQGENATVLQYSGVLGSWLYFEGSANAGGLQQGKTQLCRTNGSTVQTLSTTIPNAGGPLKGFAAAFKTMFFVGNSTQLWKTDGSSGGTVVAAELFAVPDPVTSDAKAVSTGDLAYLVAKGMAGTFPQIKVVMVDGSGNVNVLKTFDSGNLSIRRVLAYGTSALFQIDSANQTDLWITGSTPRTTRIVRSCTISSKGMHDVAVLGDQILFNETSPIDGSSTLWVSDGRKSVPITATGNVTASVTFELLDDEGDGTITPRDANAAASNSVTMSFTTGSAYQVVHADLTGLIRTLLERGDRKADLRMVSDSRLLWQIDQPGTEDVAVPSGLQITRAHGVLVDVCDANGGVLYEGLGAADMRWLAAGTYYLRVYNPHKSEQTDDLRFSVEVSPPPQGQAYKATDMDLVEGGDGDDIVVGGPHLDRLFGQSGEDAFWAEKVEVRDLEADESLRAPDQKDRLVNDPPKILDPVVNGVFVDSQLVVAVASSLGFPVRLVSGHWLFALPVHASEMNTLTRLDLRGERSIDLSGIEYATNLMTLNLAGRLMHGGLEPIEPRAAEAGKPDAGEQVGLRRLQYLGLDDTRVDASDLMTIELMVLLRTLSASGNVITTTHALHDMAEMRYLDLSNNMLTSLNSLAEMPHLKYALLQNNYLVSIGPLVQGEILDDGDWDLGYNEFLSDGVTPYRWFHNQNPVATAFRDDYHYLDADNGAVAVWSFTGLPRGSYQVLVTWHEGTGQTSAAPYAISGVDDPVTVNQKFAPIGPYYDGRPWQSLGAFEALDDGSLMVKLGTAGTDGTVVADGVMLLSPEGPAQDLRLVNLRGNGLGTDAYDIFLPLVPDRVTNPAFELLYDPNTAGPVWLEGYGPQTLLPGQTFGEIDALAANLSHDSGWQMLVGVGGSAEVLRYAGPYDASPGAFLGIAATTKQPGQTGMATVAAVARDPFGYLLVLDSSQGRLYRVDSMNGQIVTALTLPTMPGVDAPSDMTVRGDIIYLPDLASHSILRYQATLSGLVAMSSIGSLPSDADFYRIASSPDSNWIWVGTRSQNYNSDTLRPYTLDGSNSLVVLLSGYSLVDLVQADSGNLYVLASRWIGGQLPVELSVREYNSLGTFLRTVVTTNVDIFGQPAMELGPDGCVYLTNPSVAQVDKYSLYNGQFLGTVVSGQGSLTFPSFVAILPPTYSFKVVHDVGAHLLAIPYQGSLYYWTDASTGAAQVTIQAYDGQTFPPGSILQLARGRSSEITFTLQSNTGGIYGTKYDDYNHNGYRDYWEQGLENWVIYIDLDRDGQRDVGEPYTLTDANGDYGLPGVPFGYYALGEQSQDYAMQISPPPGAQIGLATVSDADFEETADGFAIDNTGATVPGLWHVTTRRGGDAGHSAAHSFWFGDEAHGNYNVGDTAGTITSGGISLVGATSATLTFNYFLNVEMDPGYDTADVYVSPDGSTWTQVASRSTITGVQKLTNDSAWHACTVNLSAFLGQTIQVRFAFDTRDPSANTFEGWFVDDVSVTANLSVRGDLGVLVDDGNPSVMGVDFGNRTIVDIGPDLVVNEGTPVWFYAYVADLELAYMLKDIRPGASGSVPRDMAIYDGIVYFSASDGTHGRELWGYNGTTVKMVADIREGLNSSSPTGLTVCGDYLYFSADDGTHGAELYRFDGKKAELVEDLNPGVDSSSPTSLFAWNGSLFFDAYTPRYGRELMVTDGTGVRLVKDINPKGDSDPSDFAVYGTSLYFAATDYVVGRELYQTNGDTVSLVANINPDPPTAVPADSSPTDLVAYDGGLFFAATSASVGRELYYWNGTSWGLLFNVAPGTANSSPTDLTVANGMLYFAASDQAGDRELYSWDGSPWLNRTDVWFGGSSNPQYLTVFDGLLYFSAIDEHGRELWRLEPLDGWLPVLAADINGSGSSSPKYLTVFGDSLVFAATDGIHGEELYRFLPHPQFSYQWTITGPSYTLDSGQGTQFLQFTPTALGMYTVEAEVGIGGTAFTFADTAYVLSVEGPPRITDILFNKPGMTVSNVDPSDAGVQLIQVTFSKVVTFTSGAVTVYPVTFEDGVEQIGDVQPGYVVTGSGTETLTITLPPGSVVDTWVKVTIVADAVRDDGDRPLDGDARYWSAYIYSPDNLPTGDGEPGGDAVFYVGSLRGDFYTDPAGDGGYQVTEEDADAFMAAFGLGDPSADMRGKGSGNVEPDGQVGPEDLDAFIAAYNAAAAAGTHLDPLPYGGGERLAAGAGQALGAAETSADQPTEVDVLALAAQRARDERALPSGGQAAPDSAQAGDSLLSAAGAALGTGDSAMALTVQADDGPTHVLAARSAAGATPAGGAALDPSGGLMDLAALTPLKVMLNS